jgi:hypothetical protein
MYIQDDKNPDGSENWNAHKMMGLGLLLADNVCIVEDTSLTVNGAILDFSLVQGEGKFLLLPVYKRKDH